MHISSPRDPSAAKAFVMLFVLYAFLFVAVVVVVGCHQQPGDTYWRTRAERAEGNYNAISRENTRLQERIEHLEQRLERVSGSHLPGSAHGVPPNVLQPVQPGEAHHTAQPIVHGTGR